MGEKQFWGSDLSWILLLIALVGDFVVPYILALFYPMYNHKKMVMSALGNPNSPVRGLYNIWLIILGILFNLSAVNLYFKYLVVSKSLSITLLVLMLMFGIGGGILAGIFSVNESQRIETIPSKIHGIGAGLGFMALTFVPLFLSILSFKNSDKVIGIISLIFFIISLILFAFFIMSEKPKFQDTILGLGGLWQRLLLLSMYVPLFFISIGNL